MYRQSTQMPKVPQLVEKKSVGSTHLIPSLDDHACAKCEFEFLVPIVRAIELLSCRFQESSVMHLEFIARLSSSWTFRVWDRFLHADLEFVFRCCCCKDRKYRQRKSKDRRQLHLGYILTVPAICRECVGSVDVFRFAKVLCRLLVTPHFALSRVSRHQHCRRSTLSFGSEHRWPASRHYR